MFVMYEIYRVCSMSVIPFLQILREDNGDALGDEIVFLTDGQATDNIAGCAPSAIQSGAILHTLAFSNSAAHALTEMANKTGK